MRKKIKKNKRTTAQFSKLMDFFESGKYLTLIRWIDKEKFSLNEYPKFPQEISINIYLLVAYVFAHEYTHHKYPDMPEEDVIKRARRFVKRMTVAETIRLTENILKKSPWEDTASFKKKRRKTKK